MRAAWGSCDGKISALLLKRFNLGDPSSRKDFVLEIPLHEEIYILCLWGSLFMKRLGVTPHEEI